MVDKARGKRNVISSVYMLIISWFGIKISATKAVVRNTAITMLATRMTSLKRPISGIAMLFIVVPLFGFIFITN